MLKGCKTRTLSTRPVTPAGIPCVRRPCHRAHAAQTHVEPLEPAAIWEEFSKHASGKHLGLNSLHACVELAHALQTHEP